MVFRRGLSLESSAIQFIENSESITLLIVYIKAGELKDEILEPLNLE